MQQDSSTINDTKRAMESNPEEPVKDVREIAASGWMGMTEFLESALEPGDVGGASIGGVADIVQLDPSMQTSLHSQQEASGGQGERVSSSQAT